MKDFAVKKITENKIQISKNKYKNTIEIIFETNDKCEKINNTIILSGEGSIKALIPA